MQDFQRLMVWQKAHGLAIEIDRVSDGFPKRRATLARQLRDAASSIASNISEGAGKATNAEFHRFLQIALGSASETQNHLLRARDTGVLHPRRFHEFAGRVDEIRRMLTSLARRVRSDDADRDQSCR